MSNLYGPEDNFDPYQAHVVAALIRKFHHAMQTNETVSIWGDGWSEREFLYVDDAVEGILHAAVATQKKFELVNIAHGRFTKIRELIDTLADVFNYNKIQYDASKPSGAQRKSLNADKCRSLLNWVPSTDLKEGISKTVDWYLNNTNRIEARC